MTETVYSPTQWTNQAMTALPQGLAWPTNPSSNLYQAILALMGTFSDHQQSAAGLLVDSFPATTIQLLPEWEATVGLPGPCSVGNLTLAQTQKHIVSRFAGLSG